MPGDNSGVRGYAALSVLEELANDVSRPVQWLKTMFGGGALTLNRETGMPSTSADFKQGIFMRHAVLPGRSSGKKRAETLS